MFWKLITKANLKKKALICKFSSQYVSVQVIKLGKNSQNHRYFSDKTPIRGSLYVITAYSIINIFACFYQKDASWRIYSSVRALSYPIIMSNLIM